MAAPIPREPPVTSAIFPSREAKALGGRKRLLQLLECLGLADRDGAKRAVAAAEQPGQHLAGADLHEGRHALLDELADSLGPFHWTGELLDEEPAEPLRALEPGGHGRQERRRG